MGLTDHLALNGQGGKNAPRLSLYPCAFNVADWDSELYNPFVPEDHREPNVDGLEGAMVLTCEWPVSTPKPVGPRRGQSFSVPWRVKMEQKSSSFLQLIECKRDCCPKALSCHFFVSQQVHDSTRTKSSGQKWSALSFFFDVTDHLKWLMFYMRKVTNWV